MEQETARDQSLLRIREIADSEAFGSRLFVTHAGLLLLGALAAVVLLDQAILATLMSLYVVAFSSEKLWAAHASRHGLGATLPFVRVLLALRAILYNLIIVYLWTLESSIYHLAAMALIVASTINIFVHSPANIANMVSLFVPNWLTFAAISALIYQQTGPSPEFYASLVIIMCITPYFILSLRHMSGTWEELSQTKRDLMQSQRLDGMGKLAGGVSHDFNNILSVVSGSLQLLNMTDDERERQDLLAVATKAIEHGATLNRQLIALGKKAPLLPRPVYLAVAVEEFKVFATRVLPENIEVSVMPFADEIKVLVDQGMLQSALLNIALNSKAAMPNGGIIKIGLRIVKRRELPDSSAKTSRVVDEYAVLSIEDTGAGMSADLVDQAFEPFFTTREIGGGSGLGLPMVKGFVEQSDGAIRLRSRRGVGTCIELFLPTTTKPVETTLDQQDEVPAIRTADHAKPRILVVEDNPQLLKILTLKLSNDGFDVVACTTGDEAKGLIRGKATFDVVLSDVVMPGDVQGKDLLIAVKEIDPTIPFIVMSGYANLTDNGGDDVISAAEKKKKKPFDLALLETEILKLLRSDRY